MKLRTLLTALAISCAASTLPAAELKVGDAAPNVSGTTETGAKLALGDVYKKQAYTLVYFYPKADTPGCTAQGCALRDSYEELTDKGIAVIGVSLDTVADQKAFKEKYGLPFTLLSDTDQSVVKAFGVPVRTLASRQAYLVKDGRIVYADYRGTTTDQAAVILKFINDQNPAATK